MKKVLVILGMLLPLGMFCACSKSDETIDLDETTDVVGKQDQNRGVDDESGADLISPIDDGDGFSAISDFFQTEIGSYSKPKPFDFKKNLGNEEKPCLVINNEDDFKEAYTGDLSLPSIDFSKYTLILGKIYLTAGTFIDSMGIRQTSPSKATLFINCLIDTSPDVGYLGVEYWEYYWNLFPKYHASEMNVEISTEYGVVDKSKKREGYE